MTEIVRGCFGDEGVDQWVASFLRSLGNPLIHSALSPRPDDSSPTWIARRHGQIVGVATPTLRDDELFGSSLWLNPGGMCAHEAGVIEDLYSAVANFGLVDHRTANYVWVPSGTSLMDTWMQLGFALMHQRGSRRLGTASTVSLPEGYEIVPGGMDYLEPALALDDALYDAQMLAPSFQRALPKNEQRADWIDALEDPDVTHLVVTRDGTPVGQGMIYTLPEQIGSHPSSAHMSAVSLYAEHRGRGLGVALTESLAAVAGQRGFDYLETNWRTTNRVAAKFWPNRGFASTWHRMVRVLRTN